MASKAFSIGSILARPESVLARALVNDALQAGAGRKDPLTTPPLFPANRARAISIFLIPGLLGMNLMNSACGDRLRAG